MLSTPSSLKLIIFDLDGTILDTVADLADAVIYALEKHGFPPRSYAEVMSFVGNGVIKLIERALPDGHKDPENVEKVYQDFNARYSAHYADKTVPYEGIPELLSALKLQGYKLAVLSNKPDKFTNELITGFFPEVFDIIRGSIDGVPRKPDPTAELNILAEIGVTPNECLHVGDSDTDILTAHNAGIKCLACTWGYRPRLTLEDAGADYIVESVSEMANFFEKTVAKEFCL